MTILRSSTREAQRRAEARRQAGTVVAPARAARGARGQDTSRTHLRFPLHCSSRRRSCHVDQTAGRRYHGLIYGSCACRSELLMKDH